MEAAKLPTIFAVTGSTNGMSAYSRTQNLYGDFGFGVPRWKEPATDSIADAVKAATSEPTASTIDAARAVWNLLRALSEDPSVVVEDDEITLEWYKDRHRVAVVSVDGESISWAVMAGPANPMKGKKPFDNKSLPVEADSAISAFAAA
jgi:glycine/D-amino acid oxidase-like deaminating enzyme